MELLIKRIAIARTVFGCSRQEIHDNIVGPECDEQTFFFAWIAASLI